MVQAVANGFSLYRSDLCRKGRSMLRQVKRRRPLLSFNHFRNAKIGRLGVGCVTKNVLGHITRHEQVLTSKVEPMAQVLAEDQAADATLREDLLVPCDVAEDVLRHAPDPEPPYFRVPKVIER